MNPTDPLDSTVFVQLLVFTDCAETKPLLLPLDHLSLSCVMYKDLSDPQGVGLLAVADDPELFVTDLRDMVCGRAFRVLMQRHDLTMTGRTEGGTNSLQQLDAIFNNPEWPWALWHPMRGTPAFANLDAAEQGAVLDTITSAAGLNADDFGQIRLKSHGLDRGGNDFMHGIHARSPQHLSRFVEAITRTEQYVEHILSAGPFFVGRTHRRTDAAGGPKARW